MDELILFRQQASELNKSELKQLFSSLIDDESFDEEFIITSMFNQMHKNLYESRETSIQIINNTITNIKNERETILDESSENESITMDSLSSSILNEIGSYLTIKEICGFEKTNRRNFISMRYPYPALHSIGFQDISWFESYSENELFDFAQFKGVKKLGLHGDLYYKLKDKIKCTTVIFRKVENLCVCGSISDNQLSFILNTCNCTSLKHLSLTELDIDSIEQANRFKKLLITNKDLKSLDIRHSGTDLKKDALFIDPTILSQQLSNLNTLSIVNSDFQIYEQIMQVLHQQIESLHISYRHCNESDYNIILNPQKGYPNLKEFCVSTTLNELQDVIDKITKKSKKIEQLNFKICASIRTSSNSNKSNQIKQFGEFTQKLVSLSELKLIQLKLVNLRSIYSNSIKIDIKNIWVGLNKFFMHHKRDMFKLIISDDTNTYCDEQILNLIAIMNSWINQFSFVLISTAGIKKETIDTLKQIVNVECYKIGENQENYNIDAVKYIISSNGDIYIPCVYACVSHLEYEATCGYDW